MKVLLIIVSVLVSLLLFFRALQWLSDRTYKPSKSEIKEIIQASIDGKLSYVKYDEFSCVKIAYDKDLDNIREKYNEIVENPEYFDGEMTYENMTPLNDLGKNKLKELIEFMLK